MTQLETNDQSLFYTQNILSAVLSTEVALVDTCNFLVILKSFAAVCAVINLAYIVTTIRYSEKVGGFVNAYVIVDVLRGMIFRQPCY